VKVLKLFYDWLVVPPADLIANIYLVPIGFAPLFVTAAAWFYSVNAIDDTHNGKPKRIGTYFIAGLIAAYVFVVTGTATIRLPHVYYGWVHSGDDN
jgi:hypothetical protein